MAQFVTEQFSFFSFFLFSLFIIYFCFCDSLMLLIHITACHSWLGGVKLLLEKSDWLYSPIYLALLPPLRSGLCGHYQGSLPA